MKICSFFFLSFILSCYSPTAQLYPTTANLSSTWNTNYSSVRPMLLRQVNALQFTCGFLCEENCTSYIFAIFLSPATDPGNFKFVWLANRDDPVQENAVPNFTAAGDLVLKNVDGSTVWSTDTAGRSIVGMNLTDTGNLVLFDDHNLVVWQSFDHPANSLLLGQKLFAGQRLKSAVSVSNYSEGMYSLQVTDEGFVGYVESDTHTPLAYYSIFVYSNDINNGRRYLTLLNGSLSFLIDPSEPSDHPLYVIDIPQASYAWYIKLMPDGHLNVYGWQSEQWTMIKDLTLVFESHPTANPSTTWNTNYSDVSSMLFTEAIAAQFTCGFLCEGDCNDHSYIFSIFLSPPVISHGKSKTVWLANRDYPVRENALLNFTAAGELVLKDGDGSIVWTTNTAGKSVAGMNLTDSGNLVLFDDQNSVVWQSFDHPADALLPGQKLFMGQKMKSSVSDTNLSEGMYFLQVTDKGVFAYVESNPPQAYYSMFVYSNDTNKGRSFIRLSNGSLSLFRHSSEPSDVIPIDQASSTQYIKLKPDGHLRLFEWVNNVVTSVYDFTEKSVDECSYPLKCGRNSVCLTNQQCICPMLEYFRPVNDRQPELGCYEITPLTCNSTQDQDFIRIENIKYFTSTADMEGVNMETCKQACLNICSCKAAFFQYYSNASSGDCFLPSELFTMKTVDPYYNASVFLKVQINVTSPPLSNQVGTVAGSTNHSSHQMARIIGATIGSFVLLLVVVIGYITYVVHKRKGDAKLEEEYLDQVPGMPIRFSFEELKTTTENFSKKLGEGGYGSVFKGTLRDGTEIAVKCLEGLAHVKKTFLAEVQSIGSIHHVNLVRLRGFCTWKSQRFLVYDFMCNGSLDKWIYHGVREQILKWDCRKKIILDIAKGLAYLHEDCRQKIVHLDIKPQNILLDNDFNAKVSDFGLSKLIDKSQTEVITSLKGTPIYMAPEWRTSVITEKLDVYSFGIVILEILCGRKIFDRSLPEESGYLLSVFQKCWEEGTLLDMVDRHSEDMQVHKTEVVEMMKLAAWCLQTNFKRRPSMSLVVKVLEGGMNVESNLDYNFTDPRIQEPTVGDDEDLTLLSSSLLSGPR